jgi:hypothetical protein
VWGRDLGISKTKIIILIKIKKEAKGSKRETIRLLKG